jgi:RNase adapter protein RapZ
MTHSAEAGTTELVVVTGVSGAGRSTALSALEDLGFYCVDSLPPQAFEPALTACEEGHLGRVALGLDARVRSFLTEATVAIDRLRSRYDFTLLFLDASDAALLARFSSTRRPHPLRTLSDVESERTLAVVDGIKLERERLQPLRAEASIVIDTSDLTVHELRRRIIDTFRPRLGGASGMATRLLSFGFKYGAPGDCDLVFDVRFMDNPHFIAALRPLSGLDTEIAEFVTGQSRATQFADQVTALLGTLVPWYEEEGKSYLTVGFGCTGGRHRSVATAEWVAGRLRSSLGRAIEVVHRDVLRADAEKKSRS